MIKIIKFSRLMVFLILLSTIVSFAVCIINIRNYVSSYINLWILPLSFFFTFFLYYILLIMRKEIKLTILVVILYSWLRCVLIPLISSIAGIYTNIGLFVMSNYVSTQKAILLMAFEQIIICLFLFLYIHFYSYKEKKIIIGVDKNVKLMGNKLLYFILIIISVTLLITVGLRENLFSFLIITLDGSGRRGDLTVFDMRATAQIIITGILFLFFIVVEFSRKHYVNSKKITYVNIALLTSLLLISLIVGERRTRQLFTAFSAIWLLIRVFPKHWKRIVLTISSMTLIVLVFMSIYKHFYTFNFSSYTAAASESNLNIYDFAFTLEKYFMGPGLVASNIGYTDIAEITKSTFVYDFIRNIFGFSFIFKEISFTTSELYNLTIYLGRQTTGHLISSLGYGYIYFGALLSPLFSLFNIFIALKIEFWLRRRKSIEMNYLFGYVYMRYAFGIFSNPIPLINLVSRELLINGLIFLIALYIQRLFVQAYPKKRFNSQRQWGLREV